MSNAKKGKPSNMSGKNHTEEAKEKNRKAHLGKPSSRLGKKCSPESIERIRQSQLARNRKGCKIGPMSEETKAKISATKKANPKPSSMLGKKHTQESIEKNRQSNRGKPNPFKGKKHTPETIEKNRQAHLGKPSGMLGKKHTQESKDKMSKSLKDRTARKVKLSLSEESKCYNK